MAGAGAWSARAAGMTAVRAGAAVRVGAAVVLGMSLVSGCASLDQDAGAGGADTPTSSGPDITDPTSDPTGSSDPTGPASVPPVPPSSTGPAAISAQLTIALDETGSGTTREMTLTCSPTGGDHPDPDAACAALATVGGAAFAQPPRDEMCTEQYGGPQVATVTGTVDGTAVQARFSRTNGCEIGRWDALATVLGSPGGGM